MYQLDEYESLALLKYDCITETFEIPDYTMFTDKDNKFEILSEEYEEIDIDEVFKIEKNEQGKECVRYKNNGDTESGFGYSYSIFDNLIVKAIKQLNKKSEEKEHE